MTGQKQQSKQTTKATPGYFGLPQSIGGAGEELGTYLQSQIGKKAKPYGGQFVAPMSGYESGILDDLFPMDLGRDFGAADYLESILGGSELGPTAEMESFIDVAQRPVREAWDEQVMPGLRTAAGRAGALTGTQFPDVMETAGRDFARELGGISTNIAYPAMEAARGRRMQAAGLAPQIAGMPVDMANRAMGLAGVPRGIEQGNLSALYQDFLRQEGQPAQTSQSISQLIAAALSGKPSEVSTTTEEQGGGLGWLGALLGLGSMAIPAYAGYMGSGNIASALAAGGGGGGGTGAVSNFMGSGYGGYGGTVPSPFNFGRTRQLGRPLTF